MEGSKRTTKGSTLFTLPIGGLYLRKPGDQTDILLQITSKWMTLRGYQAILLGRQGGSFYFDFSVLMCNTMYYRLLRNPL